jgi:transposase
LVKLVRKLAVKYGRLTFCYEAGPTGYGLYRQIKNLGHECMVVAPSLILKKPGERVKTNRRDAVGLAKQLRGGDLTAVWVPDPPHEAMRDLTRAREVAVEDLRCKRQQVSAFLLRQGRRYPGERAWTKTHRDWLVSQKLEYAEHRIAFEEMLLAMRQAQERIERLEQAIRVAVPSGKRGPITERKFRSNVDTRLPQERTDAVLRELWALDQTDNLSALLAKLTLQA